MSPTRKDLFRWLLTILLGYVGACLAVLILTAVDVLFGVH